MAGNLALIWTATIAEKGTWTTDARKGMTNYHRINIPREVLSTNLDSSGPFRKTTHQSQISMNRKNLLRLLKVYPQTDAIHPKEILLASVQDPNRLTAPRA